MSSPTDRVDELVAAYEAGVCTHLEVAGGVRDAVEIPTVAELVGRLPPSVRDAVEQRGSTAIGAWFWLGHAPSPTDQRRSRVASRVLVQWRGGRWQAWPYPERPLRTSAPEDLAAWLTHAEPDVRAAAAAALAWRGELEPGLEASLRDPDPIVRGWGGWAWAYTGGDLDTVLASIEHEPPEARPDLAWPLIDRGERDPRLAELLVPSLATSAAETALCLRELGPAALPARDALLSALADPARSGPSMQALATMGPETARLAAPLLRGRAFDTFSAGDACAIFAAAEDVRELVRLLGEPASRSRAARELEAFPCAEVAQALLATGPDSDVLEALGKMGEHGRVAVPELIRIVEAGGRDAEAAARAMGSLGEVAGDAAPLLARLAWGPETRHDDLRERNRRARRASHFAWALAGLGAAAERECLVALGNPESRVDALRVLRKLATLSPAAAPAIRACLDDPEFLVRLNAVRAATRLPDATDAMCRALEDPAADIRAEAAKGLALRPDPAALPSLRRLVDDPDEVARWCALSAIGALGSRARDTLGPVTRVLLADEDRVLVPPESTLAGRAAWTLGCIGAPEALPALTRALDDARPDVRLAAVTALARLGGPGVRGALLPLLGDPDDGVRARATEALAVVQRGDRWPAPDDAEIAPWSGEGRMNGPMRFNR